MFNDTCVRPVTGRLIKVGSTDTVAADFKLFFERTSSRGSHCSTAVFVWAELIPCLTRVFLLEKLTTTQHPIYLKAISLGPVPVATNGVVRAVSIPVVALIAYIDTVLPLKLPT